MEIGEAAAKTGLSASAIRYYENIGVLPKAQRISGRRRYSNNIIELCGFINTARAAGFTVKELKILFRDFLLSTNKPGENWPSMAKKKILELEDKKNDLEKMIQLLTSAIECKCSSLDSCEVVFERPKLVNRVKKTLL
jgi:MerR family transcriptional regulator, redox-sensitive transcriptional activator SoxR